MTPGKYTTYEEVLRHCFMVESSLKGVQTGEVSSDKNQFNPGMSVKDVGYNTFPLCGVWLKNHSGRC